MPGEQPDKPRTPNVNNGIRPVKTPEELEKLSPLEREVWLAMQQVDRQRAKLRQEIRSQQAEISRKGAASLTPDELEALYREAVHSDPPSEEEAPEIDEVQTMRFRPVGLQPARRKPRKQPKTNKKIRWLDVLGWTLEGLVILAIMLVIGNWLLQQFGISLDFLGGGSNRGAQRLSRDNGPVLNVMAEGEIYVKPTSTPVLQPPTPTVPSLLPALTPGSQVNFVEAPTPTPFVVQANPAQETRPKFAPPNRLQIPKIGLDMPVVEVTVNLGNWQVADYAVGHHQGTANAGDSSNMVLAGHRDIRGSVFLKLNELQPGDEFKVFSSAGIYRYRVSEVFEVAPTDTWVMSPSTDPVATLITCTPVGLATKRLIVKAKLII